MVFPILVEATENRVDDAVDAGHVGKHDHWSGVPASFRFSLKVYLTVPWGSGFRLQALKASICLPMVGSDAEN